MDIYYLQSPRTIQDDIRAAAADLTITWLNRLSWFGKWDCLDEIRWQLEDSLGELFSIWHSDTPESIQSVLNGKMALEFVSDWERSMILDFENTEWQCDQDGISYTPDQTDAGKCPMCNGTLYLS